MTMTRESKGKWRVEGKVECPDCGSTKFLEGPHGGLSVNVQCNGCGSTFNFTYVFNTLERISSPEEG